MLRFKRKLNTCDGEDLVITVMLCITSTPTTVGEGSLIAERYFPPTVVLLADGSVERRVFLVRPRVLSSWSAICASIRSLSPLISSPTRSSQVVGGVQQRGTPKQAHALLVHDGQTAGLAGQASHGWLQAPALAQEQTIRPPHDAL